MSWKTLSTENELETLISESFQVPQMILKHSTRCGVSSMALRRLERAKIQENNKLTCHYLDLLKYRPISNLITQKFNVWHESPQILVIKNGACVYHASHEMIDAEQIILEIEKS